MKISATLDELRKLGAVTPQMAEHAYERLQSLEQNKPTAGQALRYGAVGALAGPVAGAATDLVGGKELFAPTMEEGAPIPHGKLRMGLGRAAGGAIMGGAAPFLRYHLDRASEMRTLQQFMKEYGSDGQPKAAAVQGKLEKASDFDTGYDPQNFRQSEYGATGGYAPWILASLLGPNQDQPLDVTLKRKKQAMDAGVMTSLKGVAGAGPKLRLKAAPGQFTSKVFNQQATKLRPALEAVADPFKSAASLMPAGGATPKAKLTSAQGVALPKTTAPAGPSIAEVAKPRGFGLPMPGALKGSI